MRWKLDQTTDWDTVFALFPVTTLDGECVWLETLETRNVPRLGRDSRIFRVLGSTSDVSKEIPQPPRPPAPKPHGKGGAS